MIDKPIKKEECRNSICVFDDIDTIQPKKLAIACQALRNDLLQCGRKENIKVIATSHQLMNYKLTRDLLNSCNKIVFFPRGTSPYHITRFLLTYIGLDKKTASFVMKIPSRWIMIEKNYPSYLLYEHGCIILNKLPEILAKGSNVQIDPPKPIEHMPIIQEKRGRGRPKKLVQKEESPTEESSEEEQNIKPQKQRKHKGRPKKIIQESSEESSEVSSEVSSDDEDIFEIYD